jgi:hypothetical protein
MQVVAAVMLKIVGREFAPADSGQEQPDEADS